MHVKQGIDRNKKYSRSLNDSIAKNNMVRLIDGLVDYLINTYNIQYSKGRTNKGACAYSAADLLKLLIYGCINGVTSSRVLERWTQINKEVCWLLKEQTPSYKTICDFRKDNGEFIAFFFMAFIDLLKDEGLMTGRLWSIDGQKVKANAKRDMISQKHLKKQIQILQTGISELQIQIASSIPKEKMEGDEDQNDDPHLPSVRIDLHQELQLQEEELESKLNLLSDMNLRKHKYHSLADSDAIQLRSKGSNFPGYNVQAVVDGDYHMIAGMHIYNQANDSGALYPVIMQVSEETGIRPKVILADTGYAKLDQIIRLVREVTYDVYVPLVSTIREKKGLNFIYKEPENIVICPDKRKMYPRSSKMKSGIKHTIYQCESCQGCTVRSECAQGMTDRSYSVSVLYSLRKEYLAYLDIPSSQKYTSQRKTVSEHVFGTISKFMQYSGFKLRGMLKIKIELDLFAISYNMLHLFNLLKSGILGKKLGKMFPFFISLYFASKIGLRRAVLFQKQAWTACFWNIAVVTIYS